MPVDKLPTVGSDGGPMEAKPVVLFKTDGTPVEPQEAPHFVAYSNPAVDAESYALLVDLSDTANFPHTQIGSVDLYATFIFVDKAPNTVGAVQLGVITRVDEVDADISFLQGVSFNNASDRQVNRDRIFRHPIQLAQTGGTLTKSATLFRQTGIAAVNTGTTLPTIFGSAAPAVGDLIVRFGHTSGGAFSASVSAQYVGQE